VQTRRAGGGRFGSGSGGERVLRLGAPEGPDTLATGFDLASLRMSSLPQAPARKLAVVACMDARLDVYEILGLQEGDAHVIRNAGGVVTEDAIRSLAISQRLLGTEEIVLIHHTDCGMSTIADDEFRRAIQAETGIRPGWAVEAFDDLDSEVRQSVARVRASPFLPHRDRVRGYVYDVETRVLREVAH
jgi:carbonic anhydrase